ncbi:DegQ family serine endoprotease [Nitrospira sp. Kam-Ns4a]
MLARIVRKGLAGAASVAAALLITGPIWFATGRLDHVPPSAVAAATRPASPAPPVSQPAAAGFPEVAKAVTPAVVNITTPRERRGPVPFGQQDREDPMNRRFGFPDLPFGPRGDGPRGGGMGSGVIISPDGYIVTNHHVVEGAREVRVALPDKREFIGKVVGTDPKTDLAVVKVDARDLPFVPWGDSASLQVGEYVLAVGNPFGLNSTVTLGIVSALGRGRMGITQYEDFIQTDAAVNPGNSGGALVNTRGELVGINTAIFSQTGGYQGIGFAVPASMAKPVTESLIATGRVVRGYLGVAIQDLTPDLAESFGLKEARGALVSDVNEASPAAEAGLRQGDVIIAYDGQPVADPVALQRAVTSTKVGAKVALTVLREGRQRELTVTVGEQPAPASVARRSDGEAGSALVGVEVQDLDRRLARELGLPGNAAGVVVVNVDPESPAAEAGVVPGDVIREINRQPVKTVRDFEKAASALKKDRTALLLVTRRGGSLFITVKA